jgi:hypothetical protein
MKIEKQKLQKALEVIKPGLANKDLIEQASSFCILQDKIVTFNDEVSISYPLQLGFEGVINSSEFYSFITKSNAEILEIAVNNNEIILKAGKSKAGLLLNTEISLPIEEIGVIKKWQKLPDNFNSAINFCAGVCSKDMSRPKLTCTHITSNQIEATDSFRIAIYKLSSKINGNNLLIPANSAIKIVKLFPTYIAQGENWIHFKNEEGAIISCRIFEEDYIDLSNHINIKKGKKLNIPKSIIGIIERAEIFSKREHILDEEITLEIQENKIIIKSNSEAGWFEEKEKLNYSGEVFSFSIAPYLIKGILKETGDCIINESKIKFSTPDFEYVSQLKG